MKKLLLSLGVVLVMAGGLLWWGSNFATGMVHGQLAAQKITFPDKASLQEDNPALVKYAGKSVDNSETAKAYSEFIAGHLQKVAGGQTYSEVSGAYLKDPTNQKLAGQRQALFMGETLRGLLLNAWGWGLVGKIVMYVALVVFAAAAVVFGVAMMPAKATAKKRSKR
jgi:hypothetical protein